MFWLGAFVKCELTGDYLMKTFFVLAAALFLAYLASMINSFFFVDYQLASEIPPHYVCVEQYDAYYCAPADDLAWFEPSYEEIASR